MMNAAEKLYFARCLSTAGLLLLIAMLFLLANSISGHWLADMQRELAVSLEIVSGNLSGK